MVRPQYQQSTLLFLPLDEQEVNDTIDSKQITIIKKMLIILLLFKVIPPFFEIRLLFHVIYKSKVSN